jgi:membrane-bound lytic murein transglycosylase D
MCGGLESVRAQDPVVDLDSLIDLGQRMAEEQLDPKILEALQGTVEVNRETLEPLLRQLQTVFQGEYVLDLAALGKTARALLPALEQNEETAPYAAWLRPRLDYFDAAGQLSLLVPPGKGILAPEGTPAPKSVDEVTVNTTVNPPSRLPNPSASDTRDVLARSLSKRESPKLADRYVSRLKPVFAAFGVPEELVWVAEVESSFDVQAQSPVGAAGLFQLMPITAKSQGLVVGDRDERLHPEKSARGAASYLRHLKDRFGDWRLALAAYNAGEGRVQRLLDQTKGKTFDDIAAKLPAETQLYVPKVEAIVRRREGKTLAALAK